MCKVWRRLCAVAVSIVVTTLVTGGGTASAGVPQGAVVSAVPFANTPQVLDNSVVDMAQVGNRIVVTGSFTKVQDVQANGGRLYAQRSVFAFDPVTGAVDPAFRPAIDGVVDTVLAGPGNTVYLGGAFGTVNGATYHRLVQVSLATGQVVSTFRDPGFNAPVYDLVLSGPHLLVGGVFTAAGTVTRHGLASLNSVTGGLDDYLTIDLEGHHSNGAAQGRVGLENFALSPDGTRLVVIGNFRTADGLSRDQVFIALLQAGRAVVDPNWRTTAYAPICNPDKFDSYVRDVDFSPDGSYFVIVATGGGGAGTLCDGSARWDTAARGQDVQPRWTDLTGSDSLWSVAVSGSAVYVGGHPRWMNNPDGYPGQGAVPRPGMAALDPLNGLPLTWNPGRNPRGVGAQKMLVTPMGLYVGSDTDWIGDKTYLRPRLAYFPLAGGAATPSQKAGTLPGSVVLAGRATASGGAAINDVVSRSFTGTATPAADTKLGTGGTSWSKVRGGFMVGNTLFFGSQGAGGGAYYLYRRTFNGTTFGPNTQINPYIDPYWSNRSTHVKRSDGTVITYRGVLPTFYSQLANVTGMFYSEGRLYYTLSGSSALYWRWFSVDSGVVGAKYGTVTTTGFGSVSGMFLAGGTLYWANSSTGALQRVAFVNGVPSGATTVAAPGPSAGRDWRTRVMFLAPAANVAPTAALSSTCLGLVCTFDASGSTDADGKVASYTWSFGDGDTAGGSTPGHTFAAAGTYPVTLTVTDDAGATARKTASVTVAPAPNAGAIGFRAAAEVRTTASEVSVPVPSSVHSGDGLVLVLSTNSSSVAVTPPAGWKLEDTRTTGSLSTEVLSKVATAADPDSAVTASLSASAKVTAQLLAYSGTSPTDPVGSVTGTAEAGGTAHATPRASAAAGSWVLSMWADKQSVARSWTAPTGVSVRSTVDGSGNGDVAGLVTDGGAAVPAGPVGGLTATVPTASNQATAFTVVLTADDAPPPPNQAPQAHLSSSCAQLACSFDGTGSTDADGTVASYAWTFGDGTTGTGATPDHTYAKAGDYAVTLTVTDNAGATVTTSATVPVQAPPPSNGVGLRGSAGVSDSGTSVSLTVPDDVQPGDGLVLVLSTNSTVTGTAPAGYTQAASLTASDLNPTTQVFSRVAGVTDAGSTLTVPLSGSAKATLQLLAYQGTDGAGPIASVAGAADGSGTAHTTPTATAAAGAWVLSVWSDKQADARQWTPPATVTGRSNLAGAGNGDIATLVADSGGPVAAGPVGGLTATVPTPSNRATMLTVLLAPSA